MVKEIELKAHVIDSEAFKTILSGKAEYSSAFEKRDVYWFGQEAGGHNASGLKTPNLPVTKIRVRKEKRSFIDGTEKSRCLVTYKVKEEYNGIELNDELEFEVEPVEEFEGFLKIAGLKPGASKRKSGWVYTKAVSFASEPRSADITAELEAELTEVDGLGWFIELEILLDAEDKSEETFAKARETLLAFLDDLGVEREAIESRYYLDMLASIEQKTDKR